MAENFIALVPKFKFESRPTFLLSCDAYGLRWLRDRFLAVDGSDNGFFFVVGDGEPIESDNKCKLTIEISPKIAVERIDQTGPDDFLWCMTTESAGDAVAKLEALFTSNTPGHQYFDLASGVYRTIIVTKGEESIDVIRKMRDGWHR